MLVLCWFDLGETNKNKSTSLAAQFRNYGELVREKPLWLYIISATAGAGVFFTFIGGADYVGRNFLDLTPTEIGFYFVFVSVGYISGNYLAGRFTEKTGLEKMMVVGTAVTVVGVVISIFLFFIGVVEAASLFLPMLFVGIGNGMSLPSANAGAVSVRADLAGSAAGLTGSLQVGGGAALSYLAANMLGPNTGPYPMLAIMLGASIISLAASTIIFRMPQPAHAE